MAMPRLFLAVLPFCLSIAGCSTLSGVGGSDRLACPMPDGSTCMSMHDAYATPASQDAKVLHSNSDARTATGVGATKPRSAELPAEPFPLRSSARILRVWYAPWTDVDGNLMGEMQAYLKLDEGTWNLPHLRSGIRRQLMPLQAPSFSAPASQSADTPTPRATPFNPTPIPPRANGADLPEDSQ